jgi:hypothetical protein
MKDETVIIDGWQLRKASNCLAITVLAFMI